MNPANSYIPFLNDLGVTPASWRNEVAWLLTRRYVSSVIIGARRLHQLQDNLATVDVRLTEDELKQLDEVSPLAPEYPGWMLQYQGASMLSVAAARL
ncbi:MAG TPA: aldo/keto reductase [Pyrinomonadaceae bacterium]